MQSPEGHEEEEEESVCVDDCPCSDSSSEAPAVPAPPARCACPRDPHGLVVHTRACPQFTSAQYVYPKPPRPKTPEDLLSLESEIAKLGQCLCGQPASACVCKKAKYAVEDPDLCLCCKCPTYKCQCDAERRNAFEKWRTQRPITDAMPAVLEATHPLMQKFQATLRKFLEKENAIAEAEILNLSDDLKLSKTAYENDLEAIYRYDHDTNQQRVLIEEYEQVLTTTIKEKHEQEAKTNEIASRHKAMKEKMNQDIVNEREVMEELEALNLLCAQFERWQQETESDLTINLRVSDKMHVEKKLRAEEKRELDLIIYRLNTDVWHLESEIELYHQQLKIKGVEMEEVNDRIANYAAELEDLELEQRRLMSLWNSVLVNIGHRDKVYNSVREDYHSLQENYRTLLSNLEATKKATIAELNRSQEIAMNKDKIMYDIASANKLYEIEEAKRVELETLVVQLEEAVEMSEKDQELINIENQTMMNIMKGTKRELERRRQARVALEGEILQALQDRLLNDKAVEAMANGIKKMRDISRKQEVSLMEMENNHAKMMLDIELYKVKQTENEKVQQAVAETVLEREREIDALEERVAQNFLLITRRQRELDLVQKKHAVLAEIFDAKSPQECRIEELERQIAALRERTEASQQDWLRLQGHVVRLTQQHHRQLADINLIQKQIQICDQKVMRLQSESAAGAAQQEAVGRGLRALRGRLEVLERARKEHADRNLDARKVNVALTHEYTANLKDAEADLIQLEEDIINLEDEKVTLTQELDKVQREALVWQRKGILAVDLKRSMQAAKGEEGEIFKMKSEIHKMSVRREQLKRIGEKLAADMSLCVVRRDTATEKVRATLALEKAHGTSMSQSQYKHKLRLAKGEVQNVTKEMEAAQSKLQQLLLEADRLQYEIGATTELNNRLEERVAALQQEARDAAVTKQWYLEKVVRSQRMDAELMYIIKKQAFKINKSESAVLSEHEQSRSFNEALTNIVNTLVKEFPYVESKLVSVLNTLNINEPESPRDESPSCASITCECD